MFSVPSTETEGVCDNYDLSKLAAMGPQTYKPPGTTYTYLLGLCGNIPDSMIPKQCDKVNSTFGPVAAYQYSSTECYALGSLNAALPVSTHTYIYIIIYVV